MSSTLPNSVASNQKNYVVFYGVEHQQEFMISTEKLQLYPECWLYKTMMKCEDPSQSQFDTVYSEESLEVIADYIDGKPIHVENKSKKSLQQILSDFDLCQLSVPYELKTALKTNDNALQTVDIQNKNSENSNDSSRIDSLMKSVNQLTTVVRNLFVDNENLKKTIIVLEDKVVESEKHVNELRKLIDQNSKRSLLVEEQVTINELAIKGLLERSNKNNENIHHQLDLIHQNIYQQNSLNISENIIHEEDDDDNNNNDNDNNVKTPTSFPILDDISPLPEIFYSDLDDDDEEEEEDNNDNNDNDNNNNDNNNVAVYHDLDGIKKSPKQSITESLNLSNSKILKGNTIYINSIHNWFDYSTQWKLLYRGSRDGFTSLAFHKLCDNHGETLTLIAHQGHDDIMNIFGGYTSQKWDSSATGISLRDPTAFVFTLNNEHNISPTQYSIIDIDHAIYLNTQSGPCFGERGNTIYISDNCNTSYENYTCCTGYTSENMIQSHSLFVNTDIDIVANYFYVDDIEVYEQLK